MDDRFDDLREQARKALENRRLPAPAMRRAIRVDAGVSQQALAEAVGVSRVCLGYYEAGERRPRGDHLRRYIEALQVLREAVGEVAQ